MIIKSLLLSIFNNLKNYLSLLWKSTWSDDILNSSTTNTTIAFYKRTL